MPFLPPINVEAPINNRQFLDEIENIDNGAQNVVIPAHLLAGVTPSYRDPGSPPAWQPQRTGTITDHPRRWNSKEGQESHHNRHSFKRPKIHRASTLPSEYRRSGQNSTSVPEQVPRAPERAANRASFPNSAANRRSWRLSFVPGSPDSLTVLQNAGTPTRGSRSRSYNSALGTNPFESPSNEVSRSSSLHSNTTDPFATRPNSISSRDRVEQNDFAGRSESVSDPEKTYVPQQGRPRRRTIETIVDAIVPEPLQHKLTNVSYTGLKRVGSIHKVYERAKTRGVELQRKKWAQVVFEYGIYLFLLVFFILNLKIFKLKFIKLNILLI